MGRLPTNRLLHHPPRFDRFGRAYHLRIETVEDLHAVLELDEARWVATTAPTATINADPEFLNLMDSDGDGRLRAEEVKAAIRFTLENLSDYSGVRPGNTRLRLDAVNIATDPGRRIQVAASKILRKLASSEPFVTLQQVRSIQAEVREGGLGEAGLVLPEATDDDPVRRFIEAILATVGGRPHPGGGNGVDAASLEQFLGESRQYLSWLKQAEQTDEAGGSAILPLGEATEEAFALFSSLEKKINQFFLLGNIRQLNPDLVQRALSPGEGTAAMRVLDLAAAEAFLADAPLAAPNAENRLDLHGEVNPYYRRKLKRFVDLAILPLLGENTRHLDPSSWRSLKARLLPYEEWLGARPAVTVSRIDPELIERYLTQPIFADTVRTLIEKSYQTAFVLENLRELERLILYQAYILILVNSFVSFPTLYDPNSRALFEMGTLVMDGRHFTLAVKVLDRERHIQSSVASNLFVMYLEIHGGSGEAPFEVAVPITSGTRGNIRLGKWGIFNDVNGREWHARVVQIIENPISLGEAVILPFVRAAQAFMARLEGFSSKAGEKLRSQPSTRTAKDAKEKTAADKSPKKGELPPASLLAGWGVTIAAMGSSMAFIAQTVSRLSPKIILGTMLGLVLFLVIPAFVSAYYKLSKRDLSAILEGSGWGVNARMKLTRNQARTFTHQPRHEGNAPVSQPPAEIGKPEPIVLPGKPNQLHQRAAAFRRQPSITETQSSDREENP